MNSKVIDKQAIIEDTAHLTSETILDMLRNHYFIYLSVAEEKNITEVIETYIRMMADIPIKKRSGLRMEWESLTNSGFNMGFSRVAHTATRTLKVVINLLVGMMKKEIRDDFTVQQCLDIYVKRAEAGNDLDINLWQGYNDIYPYVRYVSMLLAYNVAKELNI